MTEQLALVDVPAAPKLGNRQQTILDALTAAGAAGLHGDECGALIHEANTNPKYHHHRDERCIDCARDGNTVLRSLRTRGLVKWRRGTPEKPGYWYAVGAPEPMPSGMTDVIPF